MRHTPLAIFSATSAYVADNCAGDSINYCWTPWVFVGTYDIGSGQNWLDNPPTYTCQEACAANYGGAANEYACSSANGVLDHQATIDTCGVGCSVAAEDYKLGDVYACGGGGASSAWVSDNCGGTLNYCWHH